MSHTSQSAGVMLGHGSLGYVVQQGARACPARAQVGAVLLTAQHAPTEKGQTIFYVIAQFVFGCAVHLARGLPAGRRPATPPVRSAFSAPD